MPKKVGQFGFPKTLHLRRTADFKCVYDNKCAVSDRHFTLYGRVNDLEYLRVGFSVSRRCGNAVTRNRLRRLYREAFRLSRPQLPTGMDLVLIHRGAGTPTLEDLKQSFVNLARALHEKLSRRSAKP